MAINVGKLVLLLIIAICILEESIVTASRDLVVTGVLTPEPCVCKPGRCCLNTNGKFCCWPRIKDIGGTADASASTGYTPNADQVVGIQKKDYVPKEGRCHPGNWCSLPRCKNRCPPGTNAHKGIFVGVSSGGSSASDNVDLVHGASASARHA